MGGHARLQLSLLWISLIIDSNQAAIAQLGERQTEDLKVPGSIPGLGKLVHAKGSLGLKA